MDRETTVGREQVQDAGTAIVQMQEDMRSAEKMGSTTWVPAKTFEELVYAIGDCLSNLASSNDEEDSEYEADNEEDTEMGNLSEDGNPGWVMGTISKTVQQHIERLQQQKMRLDQLTLPGWGDVAKYFSERDMKYGKPTLRVPAIVNHHTDTPAATPSLTPFGELM